MSDTQEKKVGRGGWRERLPLIERAVGTAQPAESLRQRRPGGGQIPRPQHAGDPAPAARTSAESAQQRQAVRQSRYAEIDLDRLADMGFLTPKGGRSRIREEFRVIKRGVLQNALQPGRSRGLPGNLVMVTSARPDEGKSFTAVNLAISIALERDYTVLLIDGDFAAPSVAPILGIESEKGMVDVLEDPSIDLSEVMIRTNIEKLSILPAGASHNLSTELLASHRMSSVVSEIAQRYQDRIVIFDAPPLLATSEPSTLAMHVGQIILVVEADRTTKAAVKEALEMITTGASVGAVLNRCSPRIGQAQFGSYYNTSKGKYAYRDKTPSKAKAPPKDKAQSKDKAPSKDKPHSKDKAPSKDKT